MKSLAPSSYLEFSMSMSNFMSRGRQRCQQYIGPSGYFVKGLLLTLLFSVALACSIKSFMVISNEIDEDQVDYDDNHIYDEPYPGQNQVPNPDLTQQNLPESAVKWQEVTLEIQQKNNDVR